MFEAFPKLTRFSHDWTVTEKIDGTNGQIVIASIKSSEETLPPGAVAVVDDDFLVYAGSRKRLLGLGKNDNYGFGQFVADNAKELVAKLGEGRHYGEWYGNGIQRGYGLEEKRFALFNATRWTGVELPNRVDVVPIMHQGYLDTSSDFDVFLEDLYAQGSLIAPNFKDPEGIVMYHGPSKTLFKKTYDYDEQGKWAENQARKATA